MPQQNGETPTAVDRPGERLHVPSGPERGRGAAYASPVGGSAHGGAWNRGRRPGHGPVRDPQRHLGQGVTAAVTPDSGRGPYEVESLISGRGGRNRTCGIRFWRPALWPSELRPFDTCSLPRAANADPQIFAVGRDGDRCSTTSSPAHPIRAAARFRRSEARAYIRSGRLHLHVWSRDLTATHPLHSAAPPPSPGWTARPGSTARIRER